MTKTKKILLAALALVLIAAAIFFAVYQATGKSFNYAKKDLSRYVSIDPAEYLAYALTVDDDEIVYPGDDETLAAIGSKLLTYKAKDETSTDTTKYLEYTDAPIGQYDQVYVNYVGRYTDGNGNIIYFTDGAKMNKSSVSGNSFQVKAGSSAAKPFADSLLGKIPSESVYKLVTAADADSKALVPENAVVYLSYSWISYTYNTDADNNRVTDESGAYVVTKHGQIDTEDKTLITEKLRVDLADVPSFFPAGFADQLEGKEIGVKHTLTFDDIDVEGTKYQYVYTVTVDWAIDEFTPFTCEYTYPDDSTEKDIYGNELKGITATFDVAVSYFHDVPELISEYTKKDSTEKESILTHDDYLNFDTTEYYKDHEVQAEATWLAANEGKAHADYIGYLSEQYKAYMLSTLVDTYNNERKYAAADLIWKNVQAKTTYKELPSRAVYITYQELKDKYEQAYSEESYTDSATEGTLYYRNEYSTFSKFMKAMLSDEISAGQSWKDVLYEQAAEIVREKLIIYYLFDKLDLEYTDEELNEAYSTAFFTFYYYIGVTPPTSAIREGVMFDKIMENLYTQAIIDWTSDN